MRQEFKKPKHVIEMLINIVAKNENMLLNILQQPNGSIDKETRYLLEEVATWFRICKEAIHRSRPWQTYGEGDTHVLINRFKKAKTS